ncbi:MAG: TonB-dependent receptor [Bacteroidales bacterium]|nr:TonB-dependent receptor [Bacteroidales bacterium]
MKKLFLLLVAVLTLGLCASAQTRTVTGVVLSAEDNEPIIGASVLPYGETRGVSTNIDGEFSITVPASVTKLTFAYVGMHPLDLAIPANNKMTVHLESNSKVLDDVIVVAYGTTTKAAYTGSASVVKADQLEDALVSNVTNAFSGKMAGVQTLSSNGQPGTSSTVLIRGVGSINAGTSPLYVVNGMPYDGDIAAISATDIESITVLKDAASTALYGARGANGVILVTTKKGKSGQAKVSVDMRWGASSRAIPDYDKITDQRQFLETLYQCLNMTGRYFYGYDEASAHAYANNQIWSSLGGYQTWTIPAGQDAFGTDGKFNPNATPGYVLGNYYLIGDDWTKESLINAFRQEYNVSITGGTDKLNYYVSGSYLEDPGIIKGSHFKRLSTRTSVDYQAKPWLKIGTNMGYIYTNSAYPDDQTGGSSSGNVFYLAQTMGPVFPMYVRKADGSILYNDTYGKKVYDYGDGADYGLGRMGTSRPVMLLANPVGALEYNVNDYLTDIFDGKWYATITPIDGLNVTGTMAFYVDNTRSHLLTNGVYGQFVSLGGQVTQEADRFRSIQGQVLASYSRTIADVNNFDVLVGYESQDYQTEYVYGSRTNLYNPTNWAINNAIDNRHNGGARSTLAHRGWLGRINYNYAGKYFLMASIRRDGSSRFAPDKRWGTFWSASAAWDINQENFMKDLTWISLLKFKASFGQNGNDNIGSSTYNAYADQYTVSGSDGVFSDASLAYKGNPDLTWEKSNNFNTGFDFAFLNGDLQGSIEYYSRQTSDMLYNVPVPPSLGYSSIPMNIGSMRNNGWEIDLSYTVLNTRNITWDISANLTIPHNKVIKLAAELLDEDGYYWASTYRFLKEGESMYQLALPSYAGVNSEGYALYWAKKTVTDDGGNPIIDSYDKNGDPIYKTEEYRTVDWTEARTTNKKETGNLMPKGYGGFSTDFKAYGFDVSLSFAYQFGGKIIDYAYQSLMDPGSSSFGSAWHKDILNAWTPTNTNTDVPRLYTSSDYAYANAMSDRWLISSNYLSLNNVTIGYTIPKKLIKRFGLTNLRVYGSAENVALWSKRKGLDPRQGFLSSNNDTYSPIRSICGGLKVEF